VPEILGEALEMDLGNATLIIRGGISSNARNLLKYILEHAAYTETGMQTYIDALDEALAESESGGGDTPGKTTYSVTNALSNVTNSNAAASVESGESYSAVLSPASGYTLNTVTVTMNGTDITSAVYSGGVITISSVTGNIVITANAVAETTYAIGTDLLVAKAGVSVISGSAGLKMDNYNNHTGRRSLYYTSGAKPFMQGTTGNEISGVYPIPIPATATSLTVTVDVALEVAIKFWKYENGDYTLYQDGSWMSMANNTATVNFTASENLFATAAFRVSSSGTFDNAHEISGGSVVLRG